MRRWRAIRWRSACKRRTGRRYSLIPAYPFAPGAIEVRAASAIPALHPYEPGPNGGYGSLDHALAGRSSPLTPSNAARMDYDLRQDDGIGGRRPGSLQAGKVGNGEHRSGRRRRASPDLGLAITHSPKEKGEPAEADSPNLPALPKECGGVPYWPEPGPKVISTRRFCGSRTPSAVCTRRCVSPKPCVFIAVAGTPLPAR